jgi:hypothetical protein
VACVLADPCVVERGIERSKHDLDEDIAAELWLRSIEGGCVHNVLIYNGISFSNQVREDPLRCTDADTMGRPELVIQFSQSLGGVGIVAYLNELDPQLAQRDVFRIQTTSKLDDDRLGVIG